MPKWCVTMLFRPSFCCNCGERIERSEWKLWTSRRFCDLCKTDFTVQEFMSKGIVVLAAVVSVVGIVNYLSGGPSRSNLPLTRAAEKQVANQNVESSKANVAVANAQPAQLETKQIPPAAAAPAEEKMVPRALASIPPVDSAARPAPDSTGPIYFCGAETKKGTPCSRKVKGNVRCWQHTGMPAMLPANKLLVSK